MNIRPEDKPKMAGIAAAIVGLNIYFFATVIPRLSGAQPAPTEQSAPPPAPAPAANTPAAPTASAATPSVIDVSAEATPPKESAADPFKPAVGEAQPDDAPLAPAKPATPPKPVPATAPTPLATQPPQLAAVKPPDAVAALPDVTLKGLIDGKPAVAVLQIGQETYNAGERQKLVGGLIVARITEAGVILHLGKKRFTLGVGHSLFKKTDAPAASNPTMPTTGTESVPAPAQ